MIAANARLLTAEATANHLRPAFIHYRSGHWIKVCFDGTYSTSLGHVYASRDEALEDIDACIGKQVTGCQVCKRIRPCKDHLSAYCLECTARFEAETSAPLLVAAGVPAGFRRDVKADWL